MRFRTREEIQQHLTSHRSSGLSIAAYCKLESIPQNTFYKWRNKEADRKAIPERSDTPPVQFLRLPTPIAVTDKIEITLPNGAKLLVPPSYDLTALRQAVRILAPLRPR
jgi:transposase-like protein